MPGPANKHMNARAFSRAHGREIPTAHTTLRPRTCARARARSPELSGGNTRSQTVPEHCLVLLTASGTIYLGCSRWIPFRSPSRPKRQRGEYLDTFGITRHRDLWMRVRERIHANARPRLSCFSFSPFSRSLFYL